MCCSDMVRRSMVIVSDLHSCCIYPILSRCVLVFHQVFCNKIHSNLGYKIKMRPSLFMMENEKSTRRSWMSIESNNVLQLHIVDSINKSKPVKAFLFPISYQIPWRNWNPNCRRLDERWKHSNLPSDGRRSTSWNIRALHPSAQAIWNPIFSNFPRLNLRSSLLCSMIYIL